MNHSIGWLSLAVMLSACASAPPVDDDSDDYTCGYAQYQDSIHPQEILEAEPDACEILREKRLIDKNLEALLTKHLKNTAIVLENPEAYRLQVLITEIVDINEIPCVIEHRFRVDYDYFYPASAIKTVGTVAALVAAQERGVALTDGIVFGDVSTGASLYTLVDLVNETQIVSSNEAFNRLYDFAGHDRMNQLFWDAGFSSLRMQHRMFSTRTLKEERQTPEVQFCPGMQGTAEGCQFEVAFPTRTSELQIPSVDGVNLMIGSSYIDPISNTLIETPMDFSSKNVFSLRDHQRLMQALLVPKLGINLGLSETSLAAILDAMKHDPVAYKPELGADSRQRFKPMLPGFEAAKVRGLTYSNKAGRALGFHIENAALSVPGKSYPIFVTAAIYVNENGRLNDDKYEYQTISFPFFTELGTLVAAEFLP